MALGEYIMVEHLLWFSGNCPGTCNIWLISCYFFQEQWKLINDAKKEKLTKIVFTKLMSFKQTNLLSNFLREITER